MSGMSFHFLVSLSLFFFFFQQCEIFIVEVLYFLGQVYFCFIFFEAIVNGSVSDLFPVFGGIQQSYGFVHADSVSCPIAGFIIPRSFLVEVWGSLMYSLVASADRDGLTSSFPISVPSISILCLIAPATTSSILFKRNGASYTPVSLQT